MSSYQDFLFTIPLRQKPKGVTRSRHRIARLREPFLRRISLNLLGFCLGVIVNEKPLDLEKTTTSVLSVNVNQSMSITVT